jgi:hypothetical protein
MVWLGVVIGVVVGAGLLLALGWLVYRLACCIRELFNIPL